MKFLIPVALLCLAVAVTANTTGPCFCNNAMIPVCGQHPTTPVIYTWYANECAMKGTGCTSGVIQVDDSNCDPADKPGTQFF